MRYGRLNALGCCVEMSTCKQCVSPNMIGICCLGLGNIVKKKSSLTHMIHCEIWAFECIGVLRRIEYLSAMCQSEYDWNLLFGSRERYFKKI